MIRITQIPYKRYARWLARPVLLHWLLAYLMALVVLGTVAQKSLGLFESQRIFFSSFIMWMWHIPLPGGRMVTAMILCSLIAKLVLDSPWQKAKAGIFISHLGVALLLVGGLLTAAFSTEGYVVLGKGEQARGFSDYHRRELTVTKNETVVAHVPLEKLMSGQRIRHLLLPFSFTIDKLCSNCTMARRANTQKPLHGIAQKVTLAPLDDYLENERNLAGIEITVSDADDADGTYITFEPMEHHPEFKIENDTYRIALARKYYSLPFGLQLIEAEKELHPGTNLPRGYRSTVLITDGALEQRAVITMNHPLRYKGYTVYQSSFNSDEDVTKSVSFAVVDNRGRVFPYVASLTLCIGLLFHLWVRLPTWIRRKQNAA